MAAQGVENIYGAGAVDGEVIVRMLQGETDSGLGGGMDHNVRTVFLETFFQNDIVADIVFPECDILELMQVVPVVFNRFLLGGEDLRPH